LLEEPLKFCYISTKKCIKVIEIVGILKVLFTALDLTIHGAVVMDFLFIQPFGWIRIINNRLGKKNPSDLNMVSTL
jgi:hypothetical protein